MFDFEFRELFCRVIDDIGRVGRLCSGFWTISPNRCRVVFIDFVYFMLSYSLHDLCDSMKIIYSRNGYSAFEF